jgi:hypothetical protein
MTSVKRFFHDRIVLLVLSVNLFLVIMTAVFISLNLDASRLNNYLVEFRAGRLVEFRRGGAFTIMEFIVFAVFIMIFNTVLSAKVYHVKRYFAVSILGLTTLLLMLGIIVSNSLLVLS